DRQDHGDAPDQASPGQRLLRRDGRRGDAHRNRDRWYPGEHDPHDHGVHHGGRRDPALVSGSVGHRGADHLGLDPDYSAVGNYRRARVARLATRMRRRRRSTSFAAAVGLTLLVPFGWLAAHMPARLGLLVGQRLGDLIWIALPRRRAMTIANLVRAFG